MTPDSVIQTLPVEAGPSPPDVAIRIRNLSKRFRIEKIRGQAPHIKVASFFKRVLSPGRKAPVFEYFWALQSLSLDIASGERVAIIGRNGAGKSTLLKILSRIIPPTEGEARIRGRVASLLEVGVGFDAKLSGRENIFVNASLHGLSKAETAERYNQIVEFAGIDPKFLEMRIKHYSSGMRVRLGFSVAAHLDPNILMLDEVLAVGDASFQEKCLERVEGLVRRKRTLLFVSHSMPAVTRFCERALWLEQGKVLMDGPARSVVDAYNSHMIGPKAFAGWSRGEAEPTSSPPSAVDASKDSDLASETQASREPAGNLAVPDAESGPLGARSQPEFLPDGTIKEPPGAELISVRLIDESLSPVRTVTADQAIGIEFVYEVLQSGKVILPAAKLFNEENVQIFSAVYTNADYMERPKHAGRYRSVVWLPPHLLNTGRVQVGVNLTTPTIAGLLRHVVIDRAFSFEVLEVPLGQPSARGTYRKLLGAVRPLLRWETTAE